MIDDIDRLQPEELLTLFKVVRLLGRLPYVHYVLAYDERTVLDVLRKTAIADNIESRALAYLEKIVQVKLDIPPTQARQSLRMFNDGLSEILEGHRIAISAQAQSRFSYYYGQVMSASLSEPRAISRYLVQVACYLPMYEAGEIDVADFLMLTHIRCAYPALYRQLYLHRDELLARGVRLNDGTPDEDKTLTWEERARKAGVPELAVRPVTHAILGLFPRMSGRSVAGLAATKRVGTSEYFDRYFYFSIPEGEVSDEQAREALRAMCDGSENNALMRVNSLFESDDSTVGQLVAQLRRILESRAADDAEATAKILRWIQAHWRIHQGPSSGLYSVQTAFEEWASSIVLAAAERQIDVFPRMLEEDGGLEFCVRVWAAAQYNSAELLQRYSNYFDFMRHSIRDAVVRNIEDGDDADLESPILAYLFFLAATESQFFKGVLLDLLGSTKKIDDIAARFISFGQMVGASPPIREFMQLEIDLLDKLLGLDAAYTHIVSSDVNPDVGTAILSRGNVNKRDLSWPNRRLFAVKELTARRAGRDG